MPPEPPSGPSPNPSQMPDSVTREQANMVVPESQTKGFRGTLARTAMSMAKTILMIPGMKTLVCSVLSPMVGTPISPSMLMKGVNIADKELQKRKQREIEEKSSNSNSGPRPGGH